MPRGEELMDVVVVELGLAGTNLIRHLAHQLVLVAVGVQHLRHAILSPHKLGTHVLDTTLQTLDRGLVLRHLLRLPCQAALAIRHLHLELLGELPGGSGVRLPSREVLLQLLGGHRALPGGLAALEEAGLRLRLQFEDLLHLRGQGTAEFTELPSFLGVHRLEFLATRAKCLHLCSECPILLLTARLLLSPTQRLVEHLDRLRTQLQRGSVAHGGVHGLNGHQLAVLHQDDPLKFRLIPTQGDEFPFRLR
mmetsp:Transcript_9365/g.24367  ORF Transcript_9365/g.24367 Transcript_9365/m.24367 type:complete len:250 (-) Transcript_9365:887-1636(-)